MESGCRSQGVSASHRLVRAIRPVLYSNPSATLPTSITSHPHYGSTSTHDLLLPCFLLLSFFGIPPAIALHLFIDLVILSLVYSFLFLSFRSSFLFFHRSFPFPSFVFFLVMFSTYFSILCFLSLFHSLILPFFISFFLDH